MNHDLLHEQASELEQLLPALMRHLFILDPDSPTAELPFAQLRVLTILQAGPRSVAVLRVDLGVSFSAISQIAARLERRGMVDRVAGVQDRRTRHVQLTARGAEIMAMRREARIQRIREALGHLTPDEREAVLKSVTILLHVGI